MVFTGGIGENSVHIREEVLKGCEWLGVEIDETKNAAGQTVISTEYSSVLCLRIPTDEEGMIAAHTLALSNLTISTMSS